MSKPSVDNAAGELSVLDAAELDIAISGMLDILDAVGLVIAMPGILDILMLAHFHENRERWLKK